MARWAPRAVVIAPGLAVVVILSRLLVHELRDGGGGGASDSIAVLQDLHHTGRDTPRSAAASGSASGRAAGVGGVQRGLADSTASAVPPPRPVPFPVPGIADSEFKYDVVVMAIFRNEAPYVGRLGRGGASVGLVLSVGGQCALPWRAACSLLYRCCWLRLKISWRVVLLVAGGGFVWLVRGTVVAGGVVCAFVLSCRCCVPPREWCLT